MQFLRIKENPDILCVVEFLFLREVLCLQQVIAIEPGWMASIRSRTGILLLMAPSYTHTKLVFGAQHAVYSKSPLRTRADSGHTVHKLLLVTLHELTLRMFL